MRTETSFDNGKLADLITARSSSGPAPEAAGRAWAGRATPDTTAGDGWIELDLRALARVKPEPPPFIMAGWIPEGEVTLLAGDGGVGKSGIALHLAACIATGRDFHGVPCAPRSVVYLSFEDCARVLHWRLSRLADDAGIELDDLADGLRVVDCSQALGAWFGPGEFGGAAGVTAAFYEAQDRIAGAQVVFVDGSADVFAGGENVRAEVKAFIRALRRLIPRDGAVILLAHVDKASAQTGNRKDAQGYSGSSGWNNGVRSRLYAFREDEAEEVILEVKKANLTKAGACMTLAYDEAAHVFRRVDSDGGGSRLSRRLAESDERAAVLAIVRAASEAGDPLPAATSGTRTAWSVAAARAECPQSLRGKAGRPRFNHQLEVLRQAGAVRVESVLDTNRNYRGVLRAA